MVKDFEDNPYANIVRTQHRKIVELKFAIKAICVLFLTALAITFYQFLK